MQRTATFSDCGLYRYTLVRDWRSPCELFGDPEEPIKRVVFIGLNPSVADERQDDPTIRRLIGFAKGWGYNGLVMLNAFAWISTDPALLLVSLRNHRQGIGLGPVGPQNDQVIREVTGAHDRVVACWGAHKAIHVTRRDADLLAIIGKKVLCFGYTGSGAFPLHPLYLKKNRGLTEFRLGVK